MEQVNYLRQGMLLDGHARKERQKVQGYLTNEDYTQSICVGVYG